MDSEKNVDSTSISIDDLMNGNALEVISSFLRENNILYEKQPFHSPFGIGCNVLIRFDNKAKEDIIVTAHYDGKGIVDNNGGVLLLLNLLQQNSINNSNYNYIFVFTDKEEDFQFGTRAFLESEYWNKKDKIKYHLNIDGIGIGDAIVVYPSQEYYINEWLKNNTTIFQTDCSPSAVKEISTYHIFSCLKEDALTIEKEQELGNCISKYMNEKWCEENYNSVERHISTLTQVLNDFVENDKFIAYA